MARPVAPGLYLARRVVCSPAGVIRRFHCTTSPSHQGGSPDPRKIQAVHARSFFDSGVLGSQRYIAPHYCTSEVDLHGTTLADLPHGNYSTSAIRVLVVSHLVYCRRLCMWVCLRVCSVYHSAVRWLADRHRVSEFGGRYNCTSYCSSAASMLLDHTTLTVAHVSVVDVGCGGSVICIDRIEYSVQLSSAFTACIRINSTGTVLLGSRVLGIAW